MEFNPFKCQVLRVTTAREVINTVYTLHGQILEVVTGARYLGVDISSGLSWNPHIDRITGNTNQTLGYIRRNIKTKNQKVRETAYNTLVCPQLEYSTPVWDPSTKEKTRQLEKIQRRAARWTTSNYDTRSSVSAMLNQLGWRTLEQRRADAVYVSFTKLFMDLWQYLSQTMSNPLTEYPGTATQLLIAKSKPVQITFYKYSFFPLAKVHWNALPEAIASLTDLDSFKVAVGKLQHTRP